MKRLIFIGFLSLITLPLFAQQVAVVDSVAEAKRIDDVARYKLYPTKNLWTFLKLDTSNGTVWQVQWSLDLDGRTEAYVGYPMGYMPEPVNGRFELYPTENIYTFIMLDRINGRTYQVQWSIDPDKRFVLSIRSGYGLD